MDGTIWLPAAGGLIAGFFCWSRGAVPIKKRIPDYMEAVAIGDWRRARAPEPVA